MKISIKKIAVIVLIIILLGWAIIRSVGKPADNLRIIPKVEGLNGVRVF